MKLTKRILAAVLACMMALCVLTACGSNGGDEDNYSIAEKIAEKLGDGVTVSTDLMTYAADYAELQMETIGKESAELTKEKVAAGTDYEDACEAANDEMDKKYGSQLADIEKRWTELGIGDLYGAEIENNNTSAAIETLVARIKEAAAEEEKTVKYIGCAKCNDYECDEESNKVVTTKGILAFVIYAD